MVSDSNLYQLGGFRPHIQWFRTTYDEKKLAEAVVGASSPLKRITSRNGNSVIELVLGIKRSGTSHLLLTEEQVKTIAGHLRLQYPRSSIQANDFESLSPIQFSSSEELIKKFTLLRPKGGEPNDNSQLNKSYGNESMLGISRSAFEHARVFYCLLNNRIEDPRLLGISNTSWTHSVSVAAFTYTLYNFDERSGTERRQNPKILDIGWAEAQLPEILPRTSSSKHTILYENQNLRQGKDNPILGFKYGKTAVIPEAELTKQLQDLFKNRIQLTDKPLVLLVHFDFVSRNVLQKYGKIDTSRWKSGIKGLFGLETPQPKMQQGRPGDPRLKWSQENEFTERRNRERERSRSPRRGQPQSLPRGSAPSPPRSKTYAPVYLVDVKEMYCRMMETGSNADDIASIARRIGLSQENGWCAGNEAALMIDVWRYMISGPPIDDLRLQHPALKPDSTSAPVATAAPPMDEDYDEETDPNDIRAASVEVPTTRISSDNPYANVESESDYDDSD